MYPLFAGTLLASALLGTAAFGQSTVTMAPAPAPAAAPNEVVYVPQLPSVADLTKAAAAQGITVEQINQTSSQITAIYKYSNGQVTTVVYQPLSAAESSAVPVPTAAPAPGTTAVVPTTTVVYQSAPGYYYDYPYYPYYYGWGWYPPVSVGIGLGFHGGGYYHGGGFRGGGWGGHGR
jgi:hypothetical protein